MDFDLGKFLEGVERELGLHQLGQTHPEIRRAHELHEAMRQVLDRTLLKMAESQQGSPVDQQVLGESLRLLRCELYQWSLLGNLYWQARVGDSPETSHP